MNEQTSSTTIAIGPGVVDYDEWSKFYYEIEKNIKHLKEPAKGDIQKMFENTQAAWIEYSSKSLYHKKHQTDLYETFSDMKRMTSKYITMAGLKGMHY